MGTVMKWFFMSLILSVRLFAQTENTNVSETQNMDAEVIEGEHKKPELYLDLKSSEVKFDDVIYNRSDFNDFFKTEKSNHPIFVK